MAQPRVKKSQFRLVAFIVAVALISPWGFATPSSRPVGCAPAPLAGGWKWQPVSRLQRGRLKVFLKHVAFGVNSTQYYVESEWGRHWRGTEPDILSMRKAAGNSTRASYVSFGPNHQYFYGIDDWRYWRIDDPDIFKIVKENAVKFVSFGPKGAVIVVLKSGAYYFRNLPTELQDCITGRARSGNEDHNRIASVSLGNNDAYFVTFEDGCWQYSGIPSVLHAQIHTGTRD